MFKADIQHALTDNREMGVTMQEPAAKIPLTLILSSLTASLLPKVLRASTISIAESVSY